MNLHFELASSIESAFANDLASPPEQKQDALIVHLKNGVTLDVHYAAPDAYSLRWNCGNAKCGIDTAPLHHELATFPNHFHDASGHILADPITRPEASPDDNLQRLIRALLDKPMLGLENVR